MSAAFRPLGYGLLCSWLFFVLCLVIRAVVGKTSCDWLTFAIACYVLLFGLVIGFLLVRHDSRNMFLTPLWYLSTVALYHGLGDLYLFWGDEIGFSQMEFVFGFDSVSLFDASIMNFFGINLVLTSLFLLSSLLSTKGTKFTLPAESIPQLKKMLVFFLALGCFVRYALFFPSVIGIISTTMPNSIIGLISLFHTGLMLLMFFWIREGGKWRYILLLLLLIDLPFAFLTLSKSVFLMNVLFLLWGAFLARPRLSYLVIGGVGLFAFYIIIKPIVGQARLLLAQNYSQGSTVSWEQRASLVQNTFDTSTMDASPRDETIAWWKRLCFLPLHVYAMDRYKEGVRFESLDKLPYIFVPRFLYPEKPIMTSMGRDFNEMVFGYRTSSLGLGPLAEGYWNYGYAGVVFVSVYIGLLLAFLSFGISWVFETRQWLLLPFALQAMEVARGPTNWFVPGFVAGVVLLFAFVFVFWVVGKIFVGSPSSQESKPRRHWGHARFR